MVVRFSTCALVAGIALTAASAARASTIREIPIPTPFSNPTTIGAGPDGRVFFTERLGNKVGAIAPDGTLTEYPIPTANAQPGGIVTGPDGLLYFTEQVAGKIARMNPDGTGFVDFPTLTASSPTSITADTTSTDGGVWFIHSGTKIGHMTKVWNAGIALRDLGWA